MASVLVKPPCCKNILQQVLNTNADDVSRDIHSLYAKYARPSSDAQTVTSTTAAKSGTSNNIATLRQFDKVFSQKTVLTLLNANADDVSRDIMAIHSLYAKYARPSSDARTVTSTSAAKSGTSYNITHIKAV